MPYALREALSQLPQTHKSSVELNVLRPVRVRSVANSSNLFPDMDGHRYPRSRCFRLPTSPFLFSQSDSQDEFKPFEIYPTLSSPTPIYPAFITTTCIHYQFFCLIGMLQVKGDPFPPSKTKLSLQTSWPSLSQHIPILSRFLPRASSNAVNTFRQPR
jgi:hypothetical protein